MSQELVLTLRCFGYSSSGTWRFVYNLRSLSGYVIFAGVVLCAIKQQIRCVQLDSSRPATNIDEKNAKAFIVASSDLVCKHARIPPLGAEPSSAISSRIIWRVSLSNVASVVADSIELNHDAVVKVCTCWLLHLCL